MYFECLLSFENNDTNIFLYIIMEANLNFVVRYFEHLTYKFTSDFFICF